MPGRLSHDPGAMTQRSGIICAGNWIVDLVHDIEHWPDESDLVRIGHQTRGVGGGAANVVSALAKFQTGLPLWPMGAIGDDDYGAYIRDALAALDLPTSQLVTKPGVATAHTHVMSVAGQSRTFFYQGGANDVLNASDFPAGTFAQTQARLFYLGYLILLGELDRLDDTGATEAARVLERAQKAGLITCVDLVSAHSPDFAAVVGASLPFIDYLILNEAEAARATGLGLSKAHLASADGLSQMGQALVGKGVCSAVVLHCPERAVWIGADGRSVSVDVTPLPSEDIASPLGAGDAFCAGLLYALHEGWDAEACLHLAHAAARASLKGVTATSAIPALRDLLPAKNA